MKLSVISFFFCLCSGVCFAQEEEPDFVENDSEKNSVRIGIGIGHSHITKDGGEEKFDLSVASFYFDADYWVTNSFALGVQTDLTMEDFVVEEHVGEEENQALESEKPISVVPVLIYKPIKNVMLIGGYGEEFCKNESFSIIRAGIEYGMHLPKHWEFGISMIYDIKIDTYYTWGFGVGLSKIINCNSHKHRGGYASTAN